MSKKSILIFDTDSEFANNIKIYLEESYRVKIVNNIGDIVPAIKLNKFTFLLSEFDMQNHDFHYMICQIKTIQPEIKVVLMYTYFDSDKNNEKSILSHVDDYIFKPFDVNILKSKLNRLGLSKKINSIYKKKNKLKSVFKSKSKY